MAKREKEEELIWRGQQYARAVGLFQRKYANAFPPTLDVLVEQRFLRKKYKDPITNDDFQLIPASGGAPTPGMIVGPGGAPQASNQPSIFGGRGGSAPTSVTTQTSGPTGLAPGIATAGGPNLGISGVVSKSKDASMKIYNGRQKYNEWAFVYLQTSQSLGGPAIGGRGGAAFPGASGQPMPPGGFGPFGPGSPGMPGGRGGMPPLPPGRGFQPMNPQGQPSPFGTPQGQAPGGQIPMQPFGRPPGS
jgi:hypothetical protein